MLKTGTVTFSAEDTTKGFPGKDGDFVPAYDVTFDNGDKGLCYKKQPVNGQTYNYEFNGNGKKISIKGGSTGQQPAYNSPPAQGATNTPTLQTTPNNTYTPKSNYGKDSPETVKSITCNVIIKSIYEFRSGSGTNTQTIIDEIKYTIEQLVPVVYDIVFKDSNK